MTTSSDRSMSRSETMSRIPGNFLIADLIAMIRDTIASLQSELRLALGDLVGDVGGTRRVRRPALSDARRSRNSQMSESRDIHVLTAARRHDT